MDWVGILRRISAQAVDLIFPPVCSGCGRLTGYAHAVCASCWAGMPFIERPYCEVLGLPFAYDPGESAVSPEAIANPRSSTGCDRWPFTKGSSATSCMA